MPNSDITFSTSLCGVILTSYFLFLPEIPDIDYGMVFGIHMVCLFSLANILLKKFVPRIFN